jgi:GNAT superfamily N-acetyltransferase
MPNVEINKYTHAYREDIASLIVNIQQQEFGISIDLDAQPDLKMIPDFYQKDKGNFWVAVADGNVAGTIALLDIGNGNAALRKMFVKAAYRGSAFGIGQMLLDTLLEWARVKKLDFILLGTTEKFLAAQRFYEKNGFEPIDRVQLPKEFPVMEVDVKFYRYQLKS